MSEQPLPIDLNNVPQYLLERARTERLTRQSMESRLAGRGLYKVQVEGSVTLRGRFTFFVAAPDSNSAENLAWAVVEEKGNDEFDVDDDCCETRVRNVECVVKPTIPDVGQAEILEEA